MKWRITWPDAVAGTGMCIIWTSLGLWAAGLREPNDLLLGVAVTLLVPAAHERVSRLLRSTSLSSPSSSSPSHLPPSPLPEEPKP